MTAGMARAMSTSARVTFANGKGSVVVFRDWVAAVREIGSPAGLRPLTATKEGDVDADPADVVRRSGTVLLDGREGRAFERTRVPGPAERLLLSRLRDLRLAGLRGLVHVERGRFDGDPGHQDIVVAGSDTREGIVGRAVAHAIRCAGPRIRQSLRADRRYRHLAASRARSPATVDAKPPELILRHDSGEDAGGGGHSDDRVVRGRRRGRGTGRRAPNGPTVTRNAWTCDGGPAPVFRDHLPGETDRGRPVEPPSPARPSSIVP